MYARILVPVDGSATAMRGLEEALRVARALGSKVRLLHVVNDQAAFVGLEAAVYAQEFLKKFRARGEAILAEARAVAHSQGIEAETLCLDVMGGPAGESIVEHARTWEADLIVLGTHGRRGFYRLVMGSDAEYVVRSSPVPVLLVRETVAKTKA
jgi:nucleotide-binding universal stress UspA family protein